MDSWKMNFLLGRPIFRGYVSFREGMRFGSDWPDTPDLIHCTVGWARIPRASSYPVVWGDFFLQATLFLRPGIFWHRFWYSAPENEQTWNLKIKIIPWKRKNHLHKSPIFVGGFHANLSGVYSWLTSSLFFMAGEFRQVRFIQFCEALMCCVFLCFCIPFQSTTYTQKHSNVWCDFYPPTWVFRWTLDVWFAWK